MEYGKGNQCSQEKKIHDQHSVVDHIKTNGQVSFSFKKPVNFLEKGKYFTVGCQMNFFTSYVICIN